MAIWACLHRTGTIEAMVSSEPNWLMLKGGANTRLGSGNSIEKETAFLGAAVEFINANGLAKETVSPPADGDREGFELRRSQLTEEGFNFLSKQFTKWLTGIDRGKNPSDTSSMSRALKKFRSAT
jgi:hypothetical protein